MCRHIASTCTLCVMVLTLIINRSDNLIKYYDDQQLFFAPHPALKHVVNNIMIGHVATDDLKVNFTFSYPPLPEHSIFFFPYDKPIVQNAHTNKVHGLYSCTITGPQMERTILSLGRNHLMIKIGFQPGALYRLMGQPMHFMLQQDYDGEAVFGSTVKNVLEALANAADFNEMKNIADKFMLSQLEKIEPFFY